MSTEVPGPDIRARPAWPGMVQTVTRAASTQRAGDAGAVSRSRERRIGDRLGHLRGERSGEGGHQVRGEVRRDVILAPAGAERHERVRRVQCQMMDAAAFEVDEPRAVLGEDHVVGTEVSRRHHRITRIRVGQLLEQGELVGQICRVGEADDLQPDQRLVR